MLIFAFAAVGIIFTTIVVIIIAITIIIITIITTFTSSSAVNSILIITMQAPVRQRMWSRLGAFTRLTSKLLPQAPFLKPATPHRHSLSFVGCIIGIMTWSCSHMFLRLHPHPHLFPRRRLTRVFCCSVDFEALVASRSKANDPALTLRNVALQNSWQVLSLLHKSTLHPTSQARDPCLQGAFQFFSAAELWCGR